VSENGHEIADPGTADTNNPGKDHHRPSPAMDENEVDEERREDRVSVEDPRLLGAI
jgi:hypothetical protein